jgi:hypothetical protein
MECSRFDFTTEVLDHRGDVLDVRHTPEGVYVLVPHGEEYKLRLTNHSPSRADVAVEVDGKEIGRWRVPAQQSRTIERPANIEQKLTFVTEGSLLGERAGVISGRRENGLVRVTFYPERYQPVNTISLMEPLGLRAASPRMERKAMSPRSESMLAMAQMPESHSGATILGERSNQRFMDVGPIRDIDRNRVCEVVFRMVATESQPYRAIGSMSPQDLGRRSPRVPPRVETYQYGFLPF